eukprot:41973-Eustigmatos_ZCMA.PRE.1
MRFDLDESYFCLGSDYILRQILGIPMGSYASAGEAIATCGYAEHRCHHTLCIRRVLTPSIRLAGLRFVDGGLLVTAIHRSVLPHISHKQSSAPL